MRRAAHQILDRPLILEDPYALRILPPEAADEVRFDSAQGQRSFTTALRRFMAVRSRFAEDEFAEAVGRGVRQYVALGAGLDTFAWRNPHVEAGVRLFEVDHPATQAWKRELTARANLPMPQGTAYVPVDFEREWLGEGLARAGFRMDCPAFFSWLGVVPYLTLDAFRETLRFFGGMAAGSGVVFDYPLPREAVDEISRSAFDELSTRVASIGEPFKLAFLPDGLAAEFQSIGWSIVSELDAAGIRKRFFSDAQNGGSRSGMARLAHYGNLAYQPCPPESNA
jgi:methyltransferase (TIGR00027 family)